MVPRRGVEHQYLDVSERTAVFQPLDRPRFLLHILDVMSIVVSRFVSSHPTCWGGSRGGSTLPALNKLSAVGVKTSGPGKYSDGGGLWLFKRPNGGGQWVLRYTVNGRRREMGLGSTSDVTLAEARQGRDRWRAILRNGKDPIRERQRLRHEIQTDDTRLRSVALEAFEARKAELKGDGKAGRWFSPLELHVLPKLGGIPVEDLSQHDIRTTLAPIWHAKADTARKAMNRLAIVLRHAAASGRSVDLQAVEKARALLGRSRYEPSNIAAMPWRVVPRFYASLTEPTTAHLALRLLILTGARSMPVRFLHESQISDNIWTIPAENLKGRKGQTAAFRVPLSSEALKVIGIALSGARDGFLFPGERHGVISDATMSRLMERRGLAERPHGFRTSLRTWLAEETGTSHEVAETCLAHVAGSKVVRAYRRTDYLDQRRELMNLWGEFVSSDGQSEADRIA